MNQANVDPAEIKKFSDIAHRWWDMDSEFKPLHEINPLRLNYVNNHSPLHGKKVVDVGCGGGILSEAMAKEGATVSGIDLAETSLEVASLHALESGLEIDYQQISVEDFALQHNEKFDIVTCLEMLEHVPDPASIIQACGKLVKPGGHVYFSTLNRNPKSWLMAIAGAEYILKMLPKGTHEFKKFIKPSELASHTRAAGLSLFDISGMNYNPLSKEYKLVKDVDVNYLMACRKLND